MTAAYNYSLEKPQSTLICRRMFAAYRPCLPTRAKQAPTGEGWLHEIKHDSFRIIAVWSEGRVRLFTKQGYDWSKRYPLVVEAL
jgi:bifunctional non-homologous end joining protein LigD